jgi:PAT family beta-lactamase induction signal transducer AmpG
MNTGVRFRIVATDVVFADDIRKDCAPPGGNMDVAEKLNGDMTKAEIVKARRKVALADVLTGLKKPKIAAMLGLGFSSGLPFLLVGNTFNYWLGDAHVDLAVIGFASWVGLSYTYQFLLAPVVDSLPLPWAKAFGRRRSWMALTQFVVMGGLFGMAASDPRAHLAGAVVFAVIAAFGSATQDVSINAWRIETAADSMELDLMTSAYSLGYRTSLILTGSVILIMAEHLGWPACYALFAALMAVGLASTLAAREPARADQVLEAKPALGLRRAFDAVAGPFIAFFRQFGWSALLILLAVTAYHLCDYLRGPVINPFYVQVHLAKGFVGSMRLAVGLPATMVGIAAGGLFAARFGVLRAMMVGGVLQPLAVGAFAILATTGPDPRVFVGLLVFDDFSISFAGVALISYISTLTSFGYTATQYALLVSVVNLSGKTLKGFSGEWVKALARGGRDLTHAYAAYFIDCALVGIPALLLVFALAFVRVRLEAQPASTVAPRS